MSNILLLFLTGLVLLGAEVFVPGAILGLLGGALLIGGCVLSFVDFGIEAGCLAVVVALVLAGLLLWFEFKVLPRTAMGRRLFLRSENHGRSQPDIATADVVGQAGEALTALAPTGYVSVGGRRYEAFSRTGFVDKGTAITVVGLDTFRLIVQLSNNNQPTSQS